MKIVVLAGGLSEERDVSLSSGSLVANALMENGHEVCLLDLYLGKKQISNDLFKMNETYEYKVSTLEPDLKKIKESNNNRHDQIGENVIEICKIADIVFIALHGGIGENGKLQAIFDTYNIKYTGCNYLGSAIAMDKNLTKKLLLNNVSTPQSILFNIKNNIDSIKLDYPLIVKPNMNGSSIGVYKVLNYNELQNAIDKAIKYDDNILIEEFIEGREFSVGIIGDKILPPIEIIPANGFYDYEHKYQVGKTLEICPAKLTDEENEILQNATLKVFNLLHLSGYARIDFILNNNKAYCLEANTLPGMTPTSLLPQEAKAIGINYNDLCELLIKSSIEKKED